MFTMDLQENHAGHKSKVYVDLMLSLYFENFTTAVFIVHCEGLSM